MRKGVEKSYWLVVIRYWGREKKSAGNGQQSLGKMKKPLLQKGGMGGPPVSFKESGHPAQIFMVAGASCSRPSLERPAP